MGIPRPLNLAAGVALLATSALASEGVKVGAACLPPGTSMEETLWILEAELSPLSVATLDATAPAPGRAYVVIGIDACTVDPPGARVTVWTNGAPQVRVVELTGLDVATRSRTLALALAEATRDFAAPVFATSAPPVKPVAVESLPAPEDPATPVVAPPVTGRPMAEDAPPGAHATESGRVVPRVGALFRVVASPATALGGGEIGLGFRRMALTVSALGTTRSVSTGSVTLVTVFASPSIDLLYFGANTSLRLSGELGFVTGSGSANAPATASSASTVHLGLGAGIASAFPLGQGWALLGVLQAGYASSLTVRASGSEVAGLSGLSVTASVGLNVPFGP
jgi:hypothetical protein